MAQKASTSITKKRLTQRGTDGFPEMNWSTRNMSVALYTRLKLYADRHRLLVHNVFNKALEIGLSELEKEEC